MPIEWTAAALDQNRLMNKARSGRSVPKGVKSATCEGCGARRSSLALYRTETMKRACRPCITGEPAADTYVAAVAKTRKARTPRVTVQPAPVPDALDLCNGCGVNAADPDSAAGYCADCERAAREPDAPEPVEPDAIEPDAIPADDPEPEPAPAPAPACRYTVGGRHCIAGPDGHDGAHDWPSAAAERRARSRIRSRARRGIDRRIAHERAAIVAPPGIEPAAPALAAVATVEPSGRPSCHRCGQTFRKSGAGLSWHLANRTGANSCAPIALSAVI